MFPTLFACLRRRAPWLAAALLLLSPAAVAQQPGRNSQPLANGRQRLSRIHI